MSKYVALVFLVCFNVHAGHELRLERWETFGGVSWGCNGAITAIETSDSGLIYFGGWFSVCDDVAANGVVAYDPATGSFHSLGIGDQNGVDGSVSALVVSDGAVYVGGNFRQAGGAPAANIARWDGSEWHSLGEGHQNGVGGPAYVGASVAVLALAVSGTDVYVGGYFTEAGGAPASRVARWDGSDWHALGDEEQNGIDGWSGPWVGALVFSGGELIVGGFFNEAGGVPVNNVARWNGSEWTALEQGQDLIHGPVRLMNVVDEEIYVGGWIPTPKDPDFESRNALAKWDGEKWNAMANPGEVNFNFAARALAFFDGDLYVAGMTPDEDLFQLSGYMARWDGNDWHFLDGDTEGANKDVFALAVSGDGLYVGGRFFLAGGEIANHVARLDGTGWSPIGSGDQHGLNGPVLAVAELDGELIAGGRFTVAGTVQANHVARWDGSQWHALESGDMNGVNDEVSVMVVSGSDLYAGGRFWQAGGLEAHRVARWDGNEWHLLDDGNFWPGVVGSRVQALAVAGEDLYVGGEFFRGGGVNARNVIGWDGDGWHALGSGVRPRASALAILENNLYVGGISEAGGLPVNSIARWDGNQWYVLGSLSQNGTNGGVSAMAVSGTDLYVGGGFTEVGAQSAVSIARWDGSDWHALGSGNQTELAGTPLTMAVSGNDLYVGGTFTRAGRLAANYVARWNGSRWFTLGRGEHNGVNGTVNALAVSGDKVYVGGSFGEAGGKVSAGIATLVLEQPVFRDAFEQSPEP